VLRVLIAVVAAAALLGPFALLPLAISPMRAGFAAWRRGPRSGDAGLAARRRVYAVLGVATLAAFCGSVGIRVTRTDAEFGARWHRTGPGQEALRRAEGRAAETP